MKVIYNERTISIDDFSLNSRDRCFQYGDGLFETIIYKNGKIQLLERHIGRLTGGMKTMNMIIPSGFQTASLSNQMESLISANHISGAGRIKLQVWRKEGGLYTPVQNEINYMITVETHDEKKTTFIGNAGFSNEVFLYPTKVSRFKTCNAMPYILAGIEKDKKRLDDVIILDFLGNISECVAANIFWVHKGVYFTPSLDTGCIEGVMRGHLIEQLRKNGHSVQEVIAPKTVILSADKVFTCNVTGIYPVERIEGQKFDTDISYLKIGNH